MDGVAGAPWDPVHVLAPLRTAAGQSYAPAPTRGPSVGALAVEALSPPLPVMAPTIGMATSALMFVLVPGFVKGQ